MKHDNILLKSALALAIVDLVLIVAILLQVNNLVKDVLEVQNRQTEIGGMREKLEKSQKIELKVLKKELEEAKKQIALLTQLQNFQKSIYGYFGTLKLTGYLDIEKWPCNPGEECKEEVNYVFFLFTQTDNNLIYDFLEDYKGNSFLNFSKKRVGLGCYQKDKGRIYSQNVGDTGIFENIISEDKLKKLLASDNNNLVTLQLTKPILTSGAGAPACYSHFRLFEVLN